MERLQRELDNMARYAAKGLGYTISIYIRDEHLLELVRTGSGDSLATEYRPTYVTHTGNKFLDIKYIQEDLRMEIVGIPTMIQVLFLLYGRAIYDNVKGVPH